MALFKKEETWFRKKYKVLGIKISAKRNLPSEMSLFKRTEALKKFFYNKVGYPLDVINPQTFNEKINWMKLFYRNDLMTRIVDKYEFKNYIKEKLGDGYTVPLLGVWDRVDDIDFDELPNQFVLKCNAQSDGKFIKIVKNKDELDIDVLKEEMQDWLKPDKTLKTSFCWAYHNVPLKIIAEEYIEQIDGQVYDYKFMCFNGEPRLVLACRNRGKDTIYENHNMDWSLIVPSHKSAPVSTINRPNNFDKMIEIARKLSKSFPFVRVDFYEIENKILLGEMTFYPNGGFNTYKPYWDNLFGSYINLPKIKIKPPFFEKVKNKNKRIFKICGKKIFSYSKSLSRKELTKKLDLNDETLQFLNGELTLTKNKLKYAENKIYTLQTEIKKLQRDLNSRPKLRPAKMRLEERIEYLKYVFLHYTGYNLNLRNPQTFNEKINWMKLFYRNDLMTRIVDKYEFKNYIKEKLGDGYTVPLLGVWDRVDDIDFDELPNQFVLKCNAQSDGKFIKIVKNKDELDIDVLKEEMQDWLIPDTTLKTSFCWAYYNVPLKIIAEEYIPELENTESDYKFFCFNGTAKCFYNTNSWVANYKHDERTITYYDMDKTPLPLIYNEYKKSDTPLVSINNFDKMVEITQLLSQNFPFVRVDFYEVNNRILIGEMTFYPGGGYGKYEPVEWDYKLGSWLDLSQIPSEHLDIPDEYSIPIKITNKVLL